MAKIKWRKWNNILHRDIGYICVGLTVIFAISGIAVNHVQDWNPNYKIEKKQFVIDPVDAESADGMVSEVLSRLNISEPATGSFRPAPDVLQIFLENHTIEVNTVSGQGTHEFVKERAVLHDFNFLHLNHPKKIWTYVSDLYALALTFLAISGLFVLKGKNGFSGRGKWLFGIGLLIPFLFILFYKYVA